MPNEQLANDFIEARKILTNVTPDTIAWYHRAFRDFAGCDTEAEYFARVKQMRERGVSAISVNCSLRAVNAYLHWVAAPHKKCSPACEHLKIPKLKEPKTVIQTFTADQVQKILQAKIKSVNMRRIQAMALLMLDTGVRLSEALKLRRDQVDLEQSYIKPMGKGQRERFIPLSIEGRKRLFVWMRQHPSPLVFSTSTGTGMTKRNAARDLSVFCRLLRITGVRTSPHTLRHTFAVMYLRNGGNVEYLRRCLGHTNILTTQRYLQSLGHEDLGKVHNNFSPLAAVR